ncbi:hypothetical protein VTL71DRAFT_5815 [Oculimacula yallundae]|uniref:aldehyde dehydrogenase (NAD(+)) n=1 Tax=Oculimacula yallundae TaxID=86028 RepID=A0ABR4BYL7_9HELO
MAGNEVQTALLEGETTQPLEFRNTVQTSAPENVKYHHGTDPSTRKPLWPVPVATSQDLEAAVEAAKHAFISWSKTTWEFRQQLIRRMSEVLCDNEVELANILSKECGKPANFAALEIQHSIRLLQFHANTPPLAETVVQDDDELRLVLKFQPLGIVGAITPWNFPLVLSMGKIAAGLLTGNVVIVKPSPFAPYSVLKFVELQQKILPPGVLQGLNGDDSLGPSMVIHPDIPKISFTGSSVTGKKIMEAGGRLLKRMTLELGGNDACIVCPDVDIAKVAVQVALGAFFNSGQICVASKRIYVHQDIYTPFLKALTDVVRSWKVGPASEDVMLGPVQNEVQYGIVKGHIEECKKKGLKFALGGEDINSGSDFVIQPAIIDNPPDDSMIVTQEPFGPIVPVLSWKTEEEVLSRANDTMSGLGGSVWSRDIDTAYRLADAIDSGTVWINSFGKPLPQGYFSGHKESGMGGELGRHGLLSYCNAKSIHHYKDASE